MKNLTQLLSICFVFTAATTLVAQDNTQLGLDIAKAQEQNREQLKTYSWQRSAKAFRNEEEKIHSLVKVWFDTEGEMESTVLSSQSSVKKQPGVRGRMQASEGQDLASMVEHSLGLSFQYVYLSKGNWIDLMDMAEVKVEEAVVVLDAKDLLVKGDEVHFILDDSIKLFKSISLSSIVDAKAFTCTIEFKTMSDGTNHPTRTVIIFPSEALKITAENIDYIKQQ
jgi:hypothetical protein